MKIVPSVTTVRGVRLLYVMATEQEYTPALQEKISPLITGVGPVEAGVSLAAALGELRMRGEPPHIVVALGSAGSARLEHLGVYQASSVRYRDMDCSPIGFERWLTPFLDEPIDLPLEPHIPGLPCATLSSGAKIISGGAYADAGADMVDMETYAYARAARKFGCQAISLRGISDGRAPLEGYADWADTLEALGGKLAQAIETISEYCEGNWRKILATAPR
jgi:adenosylhomocysteine nucleosidase